MNLNTIRLQGYDRMTFEPEEIAGVLEAVLNKFQLLQAVAIRVLGFDEVAAGAFLNGMTSHKRALGRVVELFEARNPERFAALVDEVVGAISEKTVHAWWTRIRRGDAVSPHDAVMSVNASLVALAAAKPFSEHRKSQAKRAFSDLVAAKRAGASGPKYPAFDNISR